MLHEPNAKGYWGPFGGRFVPETVIAALDELEAGYSEVKADQSFQTELDHLLQDYVGRPTPLYRAERLSAETGAVIYLKREDLCHTGAHKINNTLGQVLLAKKMGKKKVVAETGAGQHGVATATACALLGLSCSVFMGSEDVSRQRMNVQRMRLLGAEVVSVGSGSRTLKDAINEAMRHWVTHVEDTFYCMGSVVGPHPYPVMVRDFQSVIGLEARAQILFKENKLPDALVACVGGGSNAMGLFHPFLDDPVDIIGAEAGGLGLDTNKHSASLCKGRIGVLHGAKSYLLQDEHGQIMETHSVSAGLDYPGVGPEHSLLKDSGRVRYEAVNDDEALSAFSRLARAEGILPALESAHAVACAIRHAEKHPGAVLIVNLSGRGDKDLDIVEHLT